MEAILNLKKEGVSVYAFICFDLSHMCIYVSMCMFRMLNGMHMEIQWLACKPATYVNTYVYIFPCACVYEWMKYASRCRVSHVNVHCRLTHFHTHKDGHAHIHHFM